MQRLILLLGICFFFSCQSETTTTSPTITQIDLGTFTGNNYRSNLLGLNIPAGWEYNLKNISVSRQQQLTNEQVKQDKISFSTINEVSLFEATQSGGNPADPTKMPSSIACLLVNAQAKKVDNLQAYITQFRTEMAERNKETQLAQFHLSGTRDQKLNNLNYKVIDAEIKYPTVEGAENLVIKNKMLFLKKDNMIYRINLTYFSSEQLKALIKIVSSISYK